MLDCGGADDAGDGTSTGSVLTRTSAVALSVQTVSPTRREYASIRPASGALRCSFTCTSYTVSGVMNSGSGYVPVFCGDDQSFTVIPDAGFSILDVLVDGASVGAAGSYTFPNVRAYRKRLLAGLPSGSFLALYDSLDISEALNEAQQGYDDTGAVPYKLRRADQIERFFDGLELVTPGLVHCPQWRPEAGQAGGAPDVPTLAGVARKP